MGSLATLDIGNQAWDGYSRHRISSSLLSNRESSVKVKDEVS